MTDRKITLGFLENFLLSGSAAVISKTAIAPLERVKLLIQSQDELIRYGRLNKPYKGIIDCTKRTLHSEGLLAFWRSNLVNCVRYFPTQALNFAFKDHIKAAFKTSPGESHGRKLAKNIFSGSIAGALSNCFVYSLDYARTRLAMDAKNGENPLVKRQFSGVVDVYQKTWASDGIRGLYRGFFISVVSIMVYRGCYFGFYDSLKPILLRENPGFLSSFTLSYGVTVSSNLMAYPMDTIRRRMMLRSGEKVQYRGSVDCALQIIRNEGCLSLMKGAGANILRNIAGAGVLRIGGTLAMSQIFMQQPDLDAVGYRFDSSSVQSPTYVSSGASMAIALSAWLGMKEGLYKKTLPLVVYRI
ncbi:ADP/ATP carrier protein aac3 [Bulinus truncatus]|nr:ADP/ATP carrier protein aac3 [Bulinus truncatus]